MRCCFCFDGNTSICYFFYLGSLASYQSLFLVFSHIQPTVQPTPNPTPNLTLNPTLNLTLNLTSTPTHAHLNHSLRPRISILLDCMSPSTIDSSRTSLTASLPSPKNYGAFFSCGLFLVCDGRRGLLGLCKRSVSLRSFWKRIDSIGIGRVGQGGVLVSVRSLDRFYG